MDKSTVIALRKNLKGTKNYPLKIFIDNNFQIIDESAPMQFTIWDDTNGFLYAITLPNCLDNKYPSDKAKNVAICGVAYEHIQIMTIPMLKLNDVRDVLDSIKAAGATMDANAADYVINAYNGLFNANGNITASDINKLFNAGLNTNDDYYNGKMVSTHHRVGADEYIPNITKSDDELREAVLKEKDSPIDLVKPELPKTN